MSTVTASGPAEVMRGSLEVRDLTVDLDTVHGTVRALDGVCFSVAAGQTLALVGESGSGKSLTAQAIAGLLDPVARVTGGEILLNGVDVLKVSEAKRRKLAGSALGIVFQDALTALNPVYKVSRQLAEPMEIHRVATGAKARARAAELLEKVGIPANRGDAYPHEFSGGMRQRILIAMAIALDPSVLIADEPTTALDVTVQAQIMDLLGELQRERNMGLILITHDLGVVAKHASHVAVMYAGRIVERGPVSAVFTSPRHPYTRGQLDAIPARGARGAALKSIPGAPPRLSELPPGCPFAPRCHAATSRCHATEPALEPIGDDRAVACHHPEGIPDDQR